MYVCAACTWGHVRTAPRSATAGVRSALGVVLVVVVVVVVIVVVVVVVVVVVGGGGGGSYRWLHPRHSSGHATVYSEMAGRRKHCFRVGAAFLSSSGMHTHINTACMHPMQDRYLLTCGFEFRARHRRAQRPQRRCRMWEKTTTVVVAAPATATTTLRHSNTLYLFMAFGFTGLGCHQPPRWRCGCGHSISVSWRWAVSYASRSKAVAPSPSRLSLGVEEPTPCMPAHAPCTRASNTRCCLRCQCAWRK